MADTIRAMMEKSKVWGCAATLHVNNCVYKVWARGHVRVDGVHLSIKSAQGHLERGQASARARMAGLA